MPACNHVDMFACVSGCGLKRCFARAANQVEAAFAPRIGSAFGAGKLDALARRCGGVLAFPVTFPTFSVTLACRRWCGNIGGAVVP